MSNLTDVIVAVLAEHGEDYSTHCCDWHFGCECQAEDSLKPEAERGLDYKGSRDTWADHVARLIEQCLRDGIGGSQ